MATKDILLNLDGSSSCSSRIDLAIGIAKAHGAHLKGLYVLSQSYYAPRHSPTDVQAARRVKNLFCEKTAAAGVPAEWLLADWSVVGVSMAEIVTMYSYYSDLVIVGQPAEDNSSAGVPFDLPERIGLASGRPLLVVPSKGNFPMEMQRVMIAWKAGRESSRTLHDSLPFLLAGTHVTLVTVGSGDSIDQNSAIDIQRITSYLARHTIRATRENIPATLSIGEALLNHANEQKMDLLVMGGYASSRRGTYMLGPVARQVMNRMTVPVLMSH